MNSHLKLKNNLKAYRKQAKLTQTELALLVGSSKNTISSIEIEQLLKLAVERRA